MSYELFLSLLLLYCYYYYYVFDNPNIEFGISYFNSVYQFSISNSVDILDRGAVNAFLRSSPFCKRVFDARKSKIAAGIQKKAAEH